MSQELFFQELRIALHREGFASQPEQGECLPVEWGGFPLCRITAGGGVRYRQEDVATPEREHACEQVTDLACTVREYMALLEQAPLLKAQGLSGDYRTLAEFNGTVLAGHSTKHGVHFVTWDWNFDRTGLNQGHYYEENYVDAKRDFAIRSGLMPDERQFTPKQLIEIYQQCSYIGFSCSLSHEQEHIIDEIQRRIQELVPDFEERIIRGMESDVDSPFEQTME